MAIYGEDYLKSQALRICVKRIYSPRRDDETTVLLDLDGKFPCNAIGDTLASVPNWPILRPKNSKRAE
jgi:hypothetical protein